MIISHIANRFKNAIGGKERILFIVLSAGIFGGFFHGISDFIHIGFGQSMVGFSTSVLTMVLGYLYINNKIKRKTITRILIALLLPIVLLGLIMTRSNLESVIFLAIYPMLALMLLRLYEALFWILLQIIGFFMLIYFDIAIAHFNYLQIMQLMSVQVIVTVILGTYIVSTRKFQKALSLERDKLKDLNKNLESMVLERTLALEKANEHLQKKATTDHLTNVANRSLLFEVLEERLENFKRYGHIFSIIIFDIDFFKRINDQYGHNEGDKVLIAIVKIASELLRKNDLLARYGGEEFIIVLPNSDENEAKAVAEKIRSHLEEATIIEGYTITASFGVNEIRENDTIKSLINTADEALYSSKESGRNRVTLG